MSAEKVESGRVPKKGNPGEYREGTIWVSTGKGKSRRLPEKVGSGRAPEMGDPGEYRKCGIRASTENVGSGRVPGR